MTKVSPQLRQIIFKDLNFLCSNAGHWIQQSCIRAYIAAWGSRAGEMCISFKILSCRLDIFNLPGWKLPLHLQLEWLSTISIYTVYSKYSSSSDFIDCLVEWMQKTHPVQLHERKLWKVCHETLKPSVHVRYMMERAIPSGIAILSERTSSDCAAWGLWIGSTHPGCPSPPGWHYLVGGFNLLEKYYIVKLDHLPQFSGWKFPKYLSCHHLVKVLAMFRLGDPLLGEGDFHSWRHHLFLAPWHLWPQRVTPDQRWHEVGKPPNTC